MSNLTQIAVTHLMTRREAMQAEQDALRQQLATMRTRLTELTTARTHALHRFDVGYDDAQVDADIALGEIIATEAAITRAERQLKEYPARVHALNQEIDAATYRDKCKALLALQSAERAAWAEVAALLPKFFAAWHEFERVSLERTVTARSLASHSGAHGLPAPHDAAVNAPTAHDLRYWLELRPELAMSQVAAAIEKAGA